MLTIQIGRTHNQSQRDIFISHAINNLTLV